MLSRWYLTVFLALMIPLASGAAKADPGLDQWIVAFWPTAKNAGIDRRTYDNAFRGVTLDSEVLEKARYQPEFVRPVWDYLDGAVSAQRIKNGQAKLAQYASELDAIERQYGVNRHVLIAIWGMESSYGSVLKQPGVVRNVIQSLATLAYADKTRSRYAEDQLLAALHILQAGDVALEYLTGSWAGAMGHTQFIPSTYHAYAVDHDGDGRRNMWGSPIDALASTANYLARSGWASGKTWGYEVNLPKGFEFTLADEETERTLAEWSRYGITRPNGRNFPRPTDKAVLLLPAGAGGPAFLMMRNFFAIKTYNNSTAYSLAVGHLSDRLMGSTPFAVEWPRHKRVLNRAERQEMQQILTRSGFYQGKIDGKIGPKSRAAIRAYQVRVGLLPDGYADEIVLQRLRGG